MALFLGLYLGHILGDFVFQPGRLAVAKRQHLKALVLHTGIVTTCSALAVAGSLADVWPAVLLAGAAHFAVEQLSTRARRAAPGRGLAVFLLDQGLHVISLAMIAMVPGLVASPAIGPRTTSLALLAAVCGVATVAFAGSILVFEVQLCGVEGLSGTDPVLGLDAQRVYGMAERAGALVAGLALPVPALGALAFLPRLAYAIASPPDRKTRHLTAAGTGLALCALAWVLVVSSGL